MHINGDYNTFTNDELYDKYLEYLKIQQSKDDEEEEVTNFFDDELEEDEMEEDSFDDDFEDTLWEEADSEEISFEDWKEMCGYYELEEGIFTNV